MLCEKPAAARSARESIPTQNAPSPAEADARDPGVAAYLWAEAWFPDRRVGRLLVGTDCEVLWASAVTSGFLQPGSPLALHAGRLVARSKANQTRLSALVQATAQNGRRHDAFFESITDTDCTTFVVQAKGCPGGEGRIAIQLRDLTADYGADLPDFASLYGLTPTEQRILRLLLNGLCVNDIAARLNKSVLTVRTHVKRTYAKLGIGTKEQLLAVILKLG